MSMALTLHDVGVAALPLESLSDAALTRANELGASHASFHVVRNRKGRLRLRDGYLQDGSDSSECALGVRLLYDGVWGYAGTVELTAHAAVLAADEAVAVARSCQAIQRTPSMPVEEVARPGAIWTSSYLIDPFGVEEAERIGLLADWSGRLLASPTVDHVLAVFTAGREQRYYADAAGTTATQQRIYVHPMLTAFATDRCRTTVSLRTSGPPCGRGWEYLHGQGWDWDTELSQLPDHLAEKAGARPVQPGTYDLVIDPSNLWLTMHETVGHATELDRALGYEVSYAGATFVSPGELGSLRFGSPLMNVIADRTTEHGLATIGIDDEGVPAQAWPIVKDGVLVGLQTDRCTAAVAGASQSTGCSYADSALHPPLARLPNVSLEPASDGPDTDGLISAVENGIYLAGSAGWSIDPRRKHFQFTAQRCHQIRSGRLAGQLSGVAYQGSTTEFWCALSALGGTATYGLFGADMCGKGQPVQVAGASHGCPSALFRGIRVAQVGGEEL